MGKWSVEICILQYRYPFVFVFYSWWRVVPIHAGSKFYSTCCCIPQNSITIPPLNRRPVPVLVGPPGPFAVKDCADCIFWGVRIIEYSYRVHSDGRHASNDYNCFCTNPTNILSAVAIMKSFVIQDSWNEEDDVELRDHVESLPDATVRYMSESDILATMSPLSSEIILFCDSHIVQKLLNRRKAVVPSYPEELSQYYGREIRLQSLSELSGNELPYFVKLAGSDKTTMARVVRTRQEESALQSELEAGAPEQPTVYVSSVVDFVSEWRLFLSPDRLWGCQEYSEYMVGHRLMNQDLSDSTVLELCHVEQVPQEFTDQVRQAARPLGFVVVDVGLTSSGVWSVVECNPPFSLSSYDLPIDIYVDYCVEAWKDMVKAERLATQDED